MDYNPCDIINANQFLYGPEESERDPDHREVERMAWYVFLFLLVFCAYINDIVIPANDGNLYTLPLDVFDISLFFFPKIFT